MYPALVPEKSIKRYEPKVFGFKVHAAAALQRWQDKKREEMVQRLKEAGVEAGFKEDGNAADDEGEDMGITEEECEGEEAANGGGDFGE